MDRNEFCALIFSLSTVDNNTDLEPGFIAVLLFVIWSWQKGLGIFC